MTSGQYTPSQVPNIALVTTPAVQQEPESQVQTGESSPPPLTYKRKQRPGLDLLDSLQDALSINLLVVKKKNRGIDIV